MKYRYLFRSFFTLLLLFTSFGQAGAAPRPVLWPYWDRADESNSATVDHSSWTNFLDSYLVTGSSDGVNRVQYSAVSSEDRAELEGYISSLERVAVRDLNSKEQMAYWINLYNALTVWVILDHFPVESIRDIDISPGLFSDGPWGAKLLQIEGKKVTLDDIEHRILRPVYEDNRIHYAVNCASIGCPNLQPRAYTARNLEEMLEAGAREYVNSPRGARFEGNRLVVSSIYDWFQEDFGDSEGDVIEHLITYASPDLAAKLQVYRGRLRYEYDWDINAK
jgi:hypothetical protein